MKQYFYGDYGLPSITFYCTLSCLVYSNCDFAEMFSVTREACESVAQPCGQARPKMPTYGVAMQLLNL